MKGISASMEQGNKSIKVVKRIKREQGNKRTKGARASTIRGIRTLYGFERMKWEQENKRMKEV